MKHIKVKSKILLCSCRILPCPHFTLADHAIVLPKNNSTRKLVQEDFNFAIFILHLCKYFTRDDNPKRLINKALRYKLTRNKSVYYRVNINQADPSNGKTALHYACIQSHIPIVNRLLSSAGIDTNRLDNDGLPPQAYYPIHRISSCNESKFRTFIVHRSQKLFNYLFNDVVPKTWSSNVFEHITPVCFQYMNHEQKQKVIRGIRDEKGNTIMHYAAKTNKTDLIEAIIQIDMTAQFVFNSKAKLPIQYCKTNESFNRFDRTGKFYKTNYFNTDSYRRPNRNPIGMILCHFPDIIEHYNDTRPYVCANLHHFVYYLFHINPLEIKKISALARDPMDNTLWHIVSITSLIDKNFFYKVLDVSVIDHKNIFGDTALHLATDETNKRQLLQLGAHPDLLNINKEIAIVDKETKTELTLCSLQCLAARKIKQIDHVPYHLKNFVKCHHAEYCKEIYVINKV